MLLGQKKTETGNRSKYYNRFNKDFKSGSHKNLENKENKNYLSTSIHNKDHNHYNYL